MRHSRVTSETGRESIAQLPAPWPEYAAARLALVHELGAILAEDVPWIPLYLLPNLLVWNSSLVEGPGAYALSVYGGFKDIYDWRVIG